MLDSFSPRKVLTTLVLGAGLVAAQFPPQGPPQGQPQFAPQGQPQGQPQFAPQGPPQGQFQGPPQGQAQGPPQGAPQGAPQGQAALQTITGFGEVYNTQLKLQAYIPSNLPASPAIILALHMCGGTGEQYFQQTNYKSLADQKGVVVLYPSSPKDSNCWDVASKQSLTHDGKGDSQALINMVDWAIKQFKADPKKVFVTGSSSGCMMTNVMAATYPDRFAAATCYSGVAAGCMDGAPGSSPSSSGRVCSDGKVRKSGEEWAAQVRAMYPGYKGSYPKFKTFHGTADYFVFYQNFLEQVKEWSTIHGVQSTGKQTDGKGYTTETFGDGSKFVSVSAAGVGHTVPVHPELDFQWFGLN